jgi:hypothetical protein
MMVHHEGRAFADDDLTRMDLWLLLQWWGLRRARSKSFSQHGILLKDGRLPIFVEPFPRWHLPSQPMQ